MKMLAQATSAEDLIFLEKMADQISVKSTKKWVQIPRSTLLLAEDGNVNKLYVVFGHARAVFGLVLNIFFL